MDAKDLQEISQLVTKVLVVKFDEFETKINKNLSGWKSDIFNLVDGLAGEIRGQRIKQLVISEE